MTQAKEAYKDQYDCIDIKKFKECMKYDHETGDLFRRYKNNGEWKPIRSRAYGIPGYFFKIQNKRVLAQDAVWFLLKKEWPPEKIVALDGDLKNTKIENLELESTTRGYVGKTYVKNVGFGRWVARVYHIPYFNRVCSFTNVYNAEAWALKTFNEYNKWAYSTSAAAENQSDVFECPVKGIWFYKKVNSYDVRIEVNGDKKHYCYTKNIEDALEQQKIGQAEADEVWSTV